MTEQFDLGYVKTSSPATNFLQFLEGERMIMLECPNCGCQNSLPNLYESTRCSKCGSILTIKCPHLFTHPNV